METDVIKAWQVEEGDWITLGSETPWKVAIVNEDDSWVLMDEDGEHHEDNPVSLHPDEDVSLVVKWDEDFTFEEVDPDE